MIMSCFFWRSQLSTPMMLRSRRSLMMMASLGMAAADNVAMAANNQLPICRAQGKAKVKHAKVPIRDGDQRRRSMSCAMSSARGDCGLCKHTDPRSNMQWTLQNMRQMQ